MAKTVKRARKRSRFRELISGVKAMREHREGRLAPRTHEVEPIALPRLNPRLVGETREALNMSRQVFFDEAGVTAYTYLQLQETILQNRTDWHLASVSASTVVELLLSESRLRTVELI
jgi:hypothetical protein